MAALATLDGSDLDLGIRQAVHDLPAEFGGILFGNVYFMWMYKKYMHAFRCTLPSNDPNIFPMDQSVCKRNESPRRRRSACELSGKYNVAFSIVEFSSSFPFVRLGTKLVSEWNDDEDIVSGAILAATIPWATTYWPRRFKGDFVYDAIQTNEWVPFPSSKEGEAEEKSDANTIRNIYITPSRRAGIKGSDLTVEGNFYNPVATLATRRLAFVQGYLKTRSRINNPQPLVQAIENEDAMSTLERERRVLEELLDCVCHEKDRWKRAGSLVVDGRPRLRSAPSSSRLFFPGWEGMTLKRISSSSRSLALKADDAKRWLRSWVSRCQRLISKLLGPREIAFRKIVGQTMQLVSVLIVLRVAYYLGKWPVAVFDSWRRVLLTNWILRIKRAFS